MTEIKTVDAFKEFVSSITAQAGYQAPCAFGLGVRRSKKGQTLDVTFPKVNWESNLGSAAIFYKFALESEQQAGMKACKNGYAVLTQAQLTQAFECFAPFHAELEKHANVMGLKSMVDMQISKDAYADVDCVAVFIWDKQAAVESAEEAYLKLQLISQREIKPHGICMDGIFGKLTNVAWTNYGPMLPEDVAVERIKHLGSQMPLNVSHVDKFPYLLNYFIPSGVRVAAGHKVRLGAHLAEGTTVMQAGFVNFNAGTLGNAMIEGRVSAGVVVGENSDIGGGASIMGTLSGGNKTVLSVGSNCLLGANAGTGIALGDGSTIAAGVYVTAGAKVSMYNEKNEPVNFEGQKVAEGENVTKGVELSGKKNLLFLQDSQSGKIICKPNPRMIELNESLHKN
ncbi:MAG: tetrahydrodipicolinate N-succinyltransferase N-terminal domain-containing protein [Bdellovibrionales bacterium]|nr:tetrahydrodipicolinate N-succinyltransferase N-terminal domain-containing protein [Bdellovibrionales bacterium]